MTPGRWTKRGGAARRGATSATCPGPFGVPAVPRGRRHHARGLSAPRCPSVHMAPAWLAVSRGDGQRRLRAGRCGPGDVAPATGRGEPREARGRACVDGQGRTARLGLEKVNLALGITSEVGRHSKWPQGSLGFRPVSVAFHVPCTVSLELWVRRSKPWHFPFVFLSG